MAGTPDFTLILQTLCSHDVEFIVVGGVSAVLNGAPVSTFDIDIVHRRSPENVERLKAALTELNAYYRGRPAPKIRPETPQLEGPGHQLLLTDAGPVDVLGALGETGYEELLSVSTMFNLEGADGVAVLNLDRLIRLKEDLGREKDRAILPILRRTLEESQE